MNEKDTYKKNFYNLGIVLVITAILAYLTVQYAYWQLFPFTFSALFSSSMLILIYLFDYLIEGISFINKSKENATASSISFAVLAIIVVSGFYIGSSLISAGFNTVSNDEPKEIIGGGEYKGETNMDSESK